MSPITFADLVAAMPALARDIRLDDSGCWLWTAGRGGGGYAYRRIDGRHVRVHRHIYIEMVGPLPADRPVLDHLCRVRHCVNPAHLEPVTTRENTVRGLSPAQLSAWYRGKAECRNGHPYTPESTGVSKGRYRRCLICQPEGAKGKAS